METGIRHPKSTVTIDSCRFEELEWTEEQYAKLKEDLTDAQGIARDVIDQRDEAIQLAQEAVAHAKEVSVALEEQSLLSAFLHDIVRAQIALIRKLNNEDLL